MRSVRRLLAVVLVALLPLVVSASPVGAAQGSDPDPEAALAGITRVDAGDDHTCALLTTTQVRCWGSDGFRQLGDGGSGAHSLPVTVLDPTGTVPLQGVTQISAASAHTCARLATGQARCWGYNLDAELGVGDQSAHILPVVVSNPAGTGPLTDVRAVSAGWNHSCARVAGGQVRCWGANNKGQLGDGTITLRPRPVVVSDVDGVGPLTGVTQLASGLYFTCARLNTGQAACWGNNSNHQVAPGATTERRTPVLVTNPSGSGSLRHVRSVTAGYFGACAVLDSGQARCWGATPGGDEERPVAVLKGNGQPVTGIAALERGGNHLCLVTTTARAKCWGENGNHQVGDRTTADRVNPVAVVNTAGTSSLTGVAGVTVGEAHTCLRLQSGEAVCVGLNASGQLGDGTLVEADRPVGVRR